MTGLEISRKLYSDILQPALREKLPQLTGHYAAGFAGEGSDCLGYDDERSRDHDWGPGVCIWVDDDVSAQDIAALKNVVESMPDSFMSFPVRKNTPRTGVMTAKQFYYPLLGMAGSPETADQWLSIPEPSLASAVSGEVFEDNGGTFCRIREKLLAYYPEDVRLYRMAQAAAIAAQTGQYNYGRCLERNDIIAAQVIKSRFVENAAALVFLLNRKYRPFYKWTYRAMGELPVLGNAAHQRMTAISSLDGKAAWLEMENLSTYIITEMHHQNLSSLDSDFLMDHVPELLMKIKDAELVRRPLSLVF